jgi:hypothetical protein
VVAEIKERLAVNKQTMHRVHMERFNLKKLNEVEGKEYQESSWGVKGGQRVADNLTTICELTV